MCQWGANRNLLAGYRMGPSVTPTASLTPKPGVEKSPFQISANQLEIFENVNWTHYFRIHGLVVKWCNEQSCSFHQSPKWVQTDRAQHVWSSSSPITIVVMTLLSISNCLAAIWKVDFTTSSLGFRRYPEGRGQARSIARPCVPIAISSPFTRMVYLILFLSYLAGSERISAWLSDLDTMSNAALEAIT